MKKIKSKRHFNVNEQIYADAYKLAYLFDNLVIKTVLVVSNDMYTKVVAMVAGILTKTTIIYSSESYFNKSIALEKKIGCAIINRTSNRGDILLAKDVELVVSEKTFSIIAISANSCIDLLDEPVVYPHSPDTIEHAITDYSLCGINYPAIIIKNDHNPCQFDLRYISRIGFSIEFYFNTIFKKNNVTFLNLENAEFEEYFLYILWALIYEYPIEFEYESRLDNLTSDKARRIYLISQTQFNKYVNTEFKVKLFSKFVQKLINLKLSFIVNHIYVKNFLNYFKANRRDYFVFINKNNNMFVKLFNDTLKRLQTVSLLYHKQLGNTLGAKANTKLKRIKTDNKYMFVNQSSIATTDFINRLVLTGNVPEYLKQEILPEMDINSLYYNTNLIVDKLTSHFFIFVAEKTDFVYTKHMKAICLTEIRSILLSSKYIKDCYFVIENPIDSYEAIKVNIVVSMNTLAVEEGITLTRLEKIILTNMEFLSTQLKNKAIIQKVIIEKDSMFHNMSRVFYDNDIFAMTWEQKPKLVPISSLSY